MEFSKRQLLLLALLLFSAGGLARAANYYVRAGAAGSNNGSDWTNAYTALPAALSRGSTYYIADGTYSGYTFDDAVSGTSLITIKKAIASDHGTGTGWSSSYGDGLATFGSFTFTTSYWVIDGQTGGGPGSWESGFGIKLQASSARIVLLNNNAGNITFSHIDMEHYGRFTAQSQDGIYGLGTSNNIKVSYCYLHDTCRCQILTRNTNGFILEYSKLARNGYSDGIHREAWSAGVDDNVTIRYCIFENISNTGYICLVNGVGNAENWQIYGNVFYRTPGDGSSVSRLIEVKYADPDFTSAINWRIYNNAVVNLQGLGAGVDIQSGSGNIAKNNIFYNNTVSSIQFGNTSHDYNWFENNYRTNGCSPPCDLDPTLAGSETHGIHGSGDPFADWQNGDFYLTSGTSARDHGTDLGTSYDEDAYGNTRGADGNWDIGAYEYVFVNMPVGDLTGDCKVNFEDVKVLADDWLVNAYDLPGPSPTALVSYYKFDGDAVDNVGGNNGTEVGNPAYTAGRYNQAISLDGSGDYVNCGNDPSFNITSAITISAWFKGTFDVSLQRIIEKGYNWMLCSGYGDNAAFYCLGFGILEGSATVNDNQWHHIAGVFDGSKMYLYVDGDVDAVMAAAGSLKVSTANVYIGGNTSQSFTGLIDDVRIYSRALSEEEIQLLAVRIPADLNTDGTVDFKDFAQQAQHWLEDAG